VIELRDEFLSEEDLDLENLSQEELYAWWNQWLELAQATNEEDANEYSHGVFMLMNERPPEKSGFKDLSGVWSNGDAEEIKKATSDFEKIDPD
jgi:hypothetical protein